MIQGTQKEFKYQRHDPMSSQPPKREPSNPKSPIKSVQLEQLEVGMYIHDLNCSWLEHDFIKGHFLIASQEELKKVRALKVRSVKIDTSKGKDITPATEDKPIIIPSPTIAQQETKKELPSVPTAEERDEARRIIEEATRLIKEAMDSVKQENQNQMTLRLGRLVPIMGDIVTSLLRNPNALMSLITIRRFSQYQYEHALNSAVLLANLALKIGLGEESAEEFAYGGILHDMGMTKIPEKIINKSGILTAEERKLVQKHVGQGVRLISEIPDIQPGTLMMLQEHHERIDGSGYPAGLVGDEISLEGKMCAIVDSYDAMTATHSFRQPELPSRAMRKLLSFGDSLYDRGVVEGFVQSVGIYPAGTLVMLSSGKIAVVVAQGEKGLLNPIVRLIKDAHSGRLLGEQELDLGRQRGIPREEIIQILSPKQWGIRPELFI